MAASRPQRLSPALLPALLWRSGSAASWRCCCLVDALAPRRRCGTFVHAATRKGAERGGLAPARSAPPGQTLVSSAARLEPGVFGMFRPVLWLPAGIGDRLTDEEMEAILTHELCHVRRRDNLTAALHMAVEAIFWFHPLVWWLGARL